MKKLNAARIKGTQTIVFPKPPRVAGFAAIAGSFEGDGRYGEWYDVVLDDDLYGTDGWEFAESKMFEQSVRIAAQKAEIDPSQVDLLLGGDLLNQIISANYAARQLQIPFLGLYGACSTMAESLIVGASMVSAGYSSVVACAASSHFCSAERQYRFPLEYGNQRPPSAQRTVTGAGCTLLCSQEIQSAGVCATCATIGRVVDYGITDSSNMGAAMAPAAASTLCAHFKETNRTPQYYDLVVSGDLGAYGKQLTKDLCAKNGVELGDNYIDCGDEIFLPEQDTHAGGSGCGCSAVLLNSWLLSRMQKGELNRILFMATGALMNPDISLQGESVPGIAHAIALEHS